MLAQVDLSLEAEQFVFFTYLAEEILEPRRMIVISKMVLSGILIYSNQWVPFIYVITPLLPNLIMDFVIYPIIPYINFPKIFI
jgi:hypothetical protein